MTTRDQLTQVIDTLLQPAVFKDYAPNGLQVQGKATAYKLVTGVTASLALIERAVSEKADGILVHHGLFWRGTETRITGWLKERLAMLLQHDISLWAYHLPLDAHETLGNNAQLGARLGLTATGRFGDQSLGWLGEMAPHTFSEFTRHVSSVLGRSVVSVQPPRWDGGRRIRRVGWCTGGAQSYFESAIAAGVEVFVTGEISEPQAHYARECGVGYIACGHHASERYGVQALGQHLAQQVGVEHLFVDIDNPA